MAYKRRKGKSFGGGKATKGVKRPRKVYPFKGIDYKNGLERNMAIILDGADIPFEYEPKTFQLLPSFKFPLVCYERRGKGEMINRGEKTVLGIKYTPDFIGDGFVIETKGFANESFPMRWKLFKNLLFQQGIKADELVIFKPQKISECEQVVKIIKELKDGKRDETNSKQ